MYKYLIGLSLLISGCQCNKPEHVITDVSTQTQFTYVENISTSFVNQSVSQSETLSFDDDKFKTVKLENKTSYLFESFKFELNNSFVIDTEMDVDIDFTAISDNIVFGFMYSKLENISFETYVKSLKNYYDNAKITRGLTIVSFEQQLLNNKDAFVVQTFSEKTGLYVSFVHILHNDLSLTFSCGGHELTQNDVNVCNDSLNSIQFYL